MNDPQTVKNKPKRKEKEKEKDYAL